MRGHTTNGRAFGRGILAHLGGHPGRVWLPGEFGGIGNLDPETR